MANLHILQIDQFLKKRQAHVYVSGFNEHIQLHHHQVTKPHKHDFYLCVFFTNGSGVHEIDFQHYQISPGAIFMLNPGQTHSWEFSPDTDGYVFFHSKEFYDLRNPEKSLDNFPFYYTLQNSSALVLNQRKLSEIESLVRSMLHEYQCDYFYKNQKIASLMAVLYIELTREYIQMGSKEILQPGPEQERIKKLEHLIETNFRITKSASIYAEMMHISTRHLNRITHEVLGKSTTDLILKRVMLEAKRLLSQSEIPMSEIAQYLGYDDHSYFSRLFRKKVGVSPSEFVRRYR